VRWSDPPTLRSLDPHGGLWSQPPASFLKTASRILGADREAAEEAVTLSLAALTVAIEILSDLVPELGLVSFGECVRTLRADRERRALFKARYASKAASRKSEEYPGAPSMLTDPFCLSSNPSRYWFDADTCEKVVCTFIARQTLNRRRAFLDVHESGATYSLRGVYRNEDGEAPIELNFLTAEDVECTRGTVSTPCRYYVRPVYEHRKSVRKLIGAEIVLSTAETITLDVNMQTGALVDCFEGYELSPRCGQTTPSPHLVETATRVEFVPDSENVLTERPDRGQMKDRDIQSGVYLIDRYTMSLIKRITAEPDQQVAMNRALTEYFDPSRASAPLTGWSLKYDRWIQSVVGDEHRNRYSIERLCMTPEEKRPASNRGPRDPRIEEDGPYLFAVLAIWMQAQMHIAQLPTDVSTYLKANLPSSLRGLPRMGSGAKAPWTEWAKRISQDRTGWAKQMIDSWSTAWKLFEVVLQCHSSDERSRITYSEFVEAMPVKVYANYEGEFESLKIQIAELSEGV